MAPSAAGVLAIDDTGDHKEGQAVDHVARQSVMIQTCRTMAYTIAMQAK